MKNIWKYISLFFAGIVAGFMAAIKLLDPKTIHANSYVEDQHQETRIGKVKQKKGMDNLQEVTQYPSLDNTISKKAERQQRRAERKLNRKNHSR